MPPVPPRTDNHPYPTSVHYVAGSDIEQGMMVAWDGTGLAHPAAPGLYVFGVATADCEAGLPGTASCGEFSLRNSGTDPIGSNVRGQAVYAEDPWTVRRTDAGGTISAAGVAVGPNGLGRVKVIVGPLSRMLSFQNYAGPTFYNGVSRVDSLSGDDATAIAFSPSRPFRTLQAAVDAHLGSGSPLTMITVDQGQFYDDVIVKPGPADQVLRILGNGSGVQCKTFTFDSSTIGLGFLLELENLWIGPLLSPTQDLVRVNAAPLGSVSVILERCLLGAAATGHACVAVRGAAGTNADVLVDGCRIEDHGGTQAGFYAERGTHRIVQSNMRIDAAPLIQLEGDASLSVQATNLAVLDGSVTPIRLGTSGRLEMLASAVRYLPAASADVISGAGTASMLFEATAFDRSGGVAFGINCPNARLVGTIFDSAPPMPIVVATHVRSYIPGHQASTAWVDPYGVDLTGVVGRPDCQYRTIVAAIAALRAASVVGGRIVLSPGMYDEVPVFEPDAALSTLQIEGDLATIKAFTSRTNPAVYGGLYLDNLRLGDASMPVAQSPLLGTGAGLGGGISVTLQDCAIAAFGGWSPVYFDNAVGGATILQLRNTSVAAGPGGTSAMRLDDGACVFTSGNISAFAGYAIELHGGSLEAFLSYITSDGTLPAIHLAGGGRLGLYTTGVAHTGAPAGDIIDGAGAAAIEVSVAMVGGSINCPNASLAYGILTGATITAMGGGVTRWLGAGDVNYTPANAANWVAPPPALLSDATQRLETAVAGLLGAPIP